MTCPPDALVHLDQISKVFLTEELETRALSQIQLTIHDGEFVAIVGPSGCGKSTLLSVLGLLESPSSGTYCLAGRSVAALPSAELARTRAERLGFIFQAFNLIGDLDVAENVGLPLEYRQMDRTERQARVRHALDQVGMTHRAGHYPSQLSGGQQQRVAIARAIAGDPSILLADEPTGNLDSRSGDAIMELFAELHQRGRTICMVTHDMGYASRAERSIHLLDGEITQDTNVRGAATV